MGLHGLLRRMLIVPQRKHTYGSPRPVRGDLSYGYSHTIGEDQGRCNRFMRPLEFPNIQGFILPNIKFSTLLIARDTEV
jgi:hypothetical protein